ncbi:MAG: UvrD-helicase domain-containing protein [bacterium]|nr:UvrD-helicase domain-containing protein [bacterium]
MSSQKKAPEIHSSIALGVNKKNDLLDSLNPNQREAVITTNGPVLIIAGAGSGKTKTLTHRIAYLIKDKNVSAENILSLTFTNKAAREMRERIVKLIGRKAEVPTMGTFHSFCARFLRKEGSLVGLPPQFTIYDTDESRSIMKSAIVDASLSPKDVNPASILSKIAKYKDDMHDYTYAETSAGDVWERRVAKLWRAYEDRLKELNAIDFDGLLHTTVQILKNHEDVRAKYEKQFQYISVDEYQDTSNCQFQMLKLLTGTTNNVCAVGDDAQSIYGWRGAKIENIRNFPDHFEGCKVITLDQNYRSTQAILLSANQVISKSAEGFKKDLWTQNPAGKAPFLIRAIDEKDEGRRILRQFQKLFGTLQYRPSDAAILYRTNAQSRALEEACLHTGTPYEIIGGLTFYERKEVRDIIAYLRFILNPNDELAFRRMANVPTRGVGDRSVEILLQQARQNGGTPLDAVNRAGIPEARRGSLDQLAVIIDELRSKIENTRPVIIFDELLRKIQFKNYLREESERTHGRSDLGDNKFENVMELATVANRHDNLAEFIEELALISDAEKSSSKDENRQRIKMMTIHAAKGLEFPIVAVAGMEEGLLPHQNSLEMDSQLEEERRLCYVAITRAREELFLSYARTRTIYGKMVETNPSRFLDDIKDYRGDTEDAPLANGIIGSSFMDEAREFAEEELAYAPGERVRHETFGEGIIEKIQGTILFIKFKVGTKMLDGTVAPLEKCVESSV